MRGLGLQYAWDIGNTPPSHVYRHGKAADTPDADGVLIPCTAFPTVDILEALEEDLGKPVVSANQATMWKAAAMAGIGEKLEGLGSLMRKVPSSIRRY